MDQILRDAQLKLLRALPKEARSFALAGGTALELFYLKHRFSRDLDFFSSKYRLKEIDSIISRFSKTLKIPINFEGEFVVSQQARVRFYVAKIKGTNLPLKLDFVEDVFFERPRIKKFKGIPVYAVKDIYFQKIMALIGTKVEKDAIGREIMLGRGAARDVVDIYYLSEKIQPLHRFVKTLNRQFQRGIVGWYRSYSRQEVKLGVLDLDIYDKNFDVSGMISYLDTEVKKFMGEIIE